MRNSFLQSIRYLDPAKVIYGYGGGAEENVKVKFVMPLLQELGYNITNDLFFEYDRVDIIVRHKNKLNFLVECKAWSQHLENHERQYLDYMYSQKTPILLASSGQRTNLYSGLIEPTDLAKASPILTFSFDDLRSKEGQDIIDELKTLIGLHSAVNNFPELESKTIKILGSKNELRKNNLQFEELSAKSQQKVIRHKMTRDNFGKLANTHNNTVAEALDYVLNHLYEIAQKFPEVRVRYTSLATGLEFIDSTGPRTKVYGLFDIDPKKARINFGFDGWNLLQVSPQLISRLKSTSRDITTINNAIQLCELLEAALNSHSQLFQ